MKPNEDKERSEKGLKAPAAVEANMSPISNSGFSDFDDFDEQVKVAKRSATVSASQVDSSQPEATLAAKQSSVRDDEVARPEKEVAEKETFSDWSDDDDMLQRETREDVPTSVPGPSRGQTQSRSAFGRERERRETLESDVLRNKRVNNGTEGRRSPDETSLASLNGSAKDDDALEPVSDDDLDAMIGESAPFDEPGDSQQSLSRKQMLDSLEIDWASLLNDSQPRKSASETSAGSARGRFSAATVLMQVGFSRKYAGEALAAELIDFCQKEQEAGRGLEIGSTGKDSPAEARLSFMGMPGFSFLRERRLAERRNLLADTTALTSRKDLLIRNTYRSLGFEQALPLSDSSAI